MKKWLTAVLFGTVLVLGACGGGDSGNKDDGGSVDAAAGEDVYKQSCASCHGGNLEGGAGPALDKIGADLSAEDIEGVIENGQGTMPAGLVSGDDASAVAEWLAEHK